MKNVKEQKGITLIALIITIIVMLILVGVTLNVALNGGLFEKAKSTKELTQIQTEKEELISIAVAAWDEKESKVDSTKIILGDRFEKDTSKTTENKIVIKAKDTNNLWQIDVTSAKVGEYEELQTKDYTFTIGDIAKIYSSGSEGSIALFATDFWPNTVSDELKNNKTVNSNTTIGGNTWYYFNNVSCSNSNLQNIGTENVQEFMEGEFSNSYGIYSVNMGGQDMIIISINIDGTIIDSRVDLNNYKDISFTISK